MIQDDIEGRMRMCLSGSSFDDNLKHNIYFHLAEKEVTVSSR